MFARSAPICDRNLLAQEGPALLSRVHKNDRQQGSHRGDQKHFHAARIARSRIGALYSELSNAKQKCND